MRLVATWSSEGLCQGVKISFLKNSLQGAFLSWAPCSLAYCSHCDTASITWSFPLPREDTCRDVIYFRKSHLCNKLKQQSFTHLKQQHPVFVWGLFMFCDACVSLCYVCFHLISSSVFLCAVSQPFVSVSLLLPHPHQFPVVIFPSCFHFFIIPGVFILSVPILTSVVHYWFPCLSPALLMFPMLICDQILQFVVSFDTMAAFCFCLL